VLETSGICGGLEIGLKKKRFIITLLSLLFVFLLVFFSSSTCLLQVNTEAVAETRRSALVEAASSLQLEHIGAFRWAHPMGIGGYGSEFFYMNAYSTLQALMTLKILNGLDHVKVNEATQYLSYKQHPQSGGYVSFLEEDGTIIGFDLCTTYHVVHALKLLDALEKLNTTKLTDFVLARYDDSVGAFHELVTQVDGRNYSISGFSMIFPEGNDGHMAYANSNVITTCFGVSILADLIKLDLINVTKTFNWVMSCKGINGMFKPFPNATRFNGFFVVDRNSTGIPYTYTAVSALKSLNRLDSLSKEDKERITDYIVSCYVGYGKFLIHKDWDDAERFSTEYAVATLNYLNMLNDTRAQTIFADIYSFFLSQQSLFHDNSWPVPQPVKPHGFYGEPYGLYRGVPDEIHRVVRILNFTNGLSILDQPTARASAARINLYIFSALLTALAIGLPTIAMLVFLKIQNWRLVKRIQTTPP
jgi:prenyltransferase beta subunit